MLSDRGQLTNFVNLRSAKLQKFVSNGAAGRINQIGMGLKSHISGGKWNLSSNESVRVFAQNLGDAKSNIESRSTLRCNTKLRQRYSIQFSVDVLLTLRRK